MFEQIMEALNANVLTYNEMHEILELLQEKMDDLEEAMFKS